MVIQDMLHNKSLSITVLLVLLHLSCKKTDPELQMDPEIFSDKVIKGFSEILGRPTGSSVTMSIITESNADIYWEFGTAPDVYTIKTQTYSLEKDIPLEVVFNNLKGNTAYYYRTKYRFTGTSSDFISGPMRIFNTQRAPGSTFTFTIEADEHLYDKKGVNSIYQICLNNQAANKPDFMISLGDIFGDDRNAETISSKEIGILHKQYRPFLGSICHSVPLYICLGNHEGENGYFMQQSPSDNLAVNATIARKYYYPNPYPDNFYTGNSETEPYGIGNPENYYAWIWGDALFVVLDVYRGSGNSSAKPEKWEWSLGANQYNWLKNTLEKSSTKYKFVFAHHIRGQGRGGISNAKLYEWGGYEADGVTYGFTENRPGWAKPIHKLFVDNKVNIFFQGHDHVFAHGVMDGVTYQALPMPSDSTYQIGILANGDSYTSDVVGGTGHLCVNFTPSGIKVDFIQAYLPADENGTRENGKSAFSYVVK